MPTVLVDSNGIVRRDWFLRSEAWRLLAYQSASGICDLVVPEVVIRETVGAYRRTLRDLLAKVHPLERDLAAMQVRLPAPDVDADAQTDEYERQLRARLARASAGTPEPPQSLTVLDLADRAIARRRPFNENGNGFRDSVIWQHVLDALGTNYAIVAFISDDRKAFYGSAGEGRARPTLLGELEAEAKAINATSSVTLFASVLDYVIASGTPNPTLMLEVSDLVQSEQAQLTVNLGAILADEQVDLWEPFDRLVIKRVLGTLHVVVQGVAIASPDGRVLVELTANGAVLASVERWHAPTEVTEVPTAVYCGVSATYDQREGTLDNLTLEWVEAIDPRLPPPATWYDQPLPFPDT